MSENGMREERAKFQDLQWWPGLSEKTSEVRAVGARENSSGKEVQKVTGLRS